MEQEIKNVTMSYTVNNEPYQTLNDPVIMIGEDNESYHVKLNPQNDMKLGINEIVCSLVGLQLELPVFEPIIANVSGDIINSDSRLQKFSEGEHFATHHLEPFETFLHMNLKENKLLRN